MAIAFFLLIITTLAINIFEKLCSNIVVGNSVAKYALYEVLIGISGSVFFFFSSGCKINMNLTTLIYALVYAIVCLISTPIGLLLYKLATIAGIRIISSLFSLVGGLVLGFFVFNESIGPMHIIRILIISVAVFMIFLDAKKQEKDRVVVTKDQKKKSGFITFIVFAASLLIGWVSTYITKSFSISEKVTDESSWLFMLHIFHIFIPLIVFIIACLKDRRQFASSAELLRPKGIFTVVFRTALCNMSSLVGLWIMARMDLSIYNPISICIGLILGVVSSWIFRERMGVFSYLAVVVSCITFII